MNPNYQEFKFPKINKQPMEKIFGEKTDPLLVELLSKIIVYDPNQRLKPFEALAMPYFDSLREKINYLPNGNQIPDLFNFTMEERNAAGEEMM